MATVTINIGLSKIAYINQAYPATHYTINSSTWYSIAKGSGSTNKGLLFGVNAFPASLKHNKLVTAGVFWHVRNQESTKCILSVQQSESDFNANTVTYNTAPTFSGLGNCNGELAASTEADVSLPASPASLPEELGGKLALSLLTAKSFKIYSTKYSFDDKISAKTVLAGGGSPYVQIYYDNAVKSKSQVSYKSGPISGYVNPRYSTTFQWQYVKADSIICYSNTWTQSSATFYWKTSTASTWNSVTVSGATTSVTIPGSEQSPTFPTASTIQWYVSGTDEDGTTTQTPVYSFSTAAGTTYATPIVPKTSVEDGSASILFQWAISSTDGQPASRVAAFWKLYENTSDPWTPLFDISSPTSSTFEAPDGTFPAGDIVWTICAYNIDGTIGPYQEARFICRAAPSPVQGLSATSVPLTTISWQSTGQEAYEITIDGVVVKRAFGPDVYNYQVEDPLPNGDHIISVIIQGVYGLWSQPSTVTITIENQTTQDINLQGYFGVDASLSWDVITDKAFIYRDGKRIGESSSSGFIDRLCMGEHSYFVRQFLSDGNYNQSNTVTGIIEVECGQIAPLSGGDWLELEYSKMLPVQTYTRNRTVSIKHYCGSMYPVVEKSAYFDFNGSFNVMFTNLADATEFENLFGQMVVMKNRGGKILVGIFAQLDCRVEDFYFDYDFMIQNATYEDYVYES